MSNYPDDYRGAVDTIIVLQCNNCGHTWDAKATKEFGTYSLYDQEDEACPACKKGKGE